MARFSNLRLIGVFIAGGVAGCLLSAVLLRAATGDSAELDRTSVRDDMQTLDLDAVSADLPSLAETMTEEQFHDRLQSLRRYYSGDRFALARLDERQAYVDRNHDRARSGQAQCLTRGLEYLHSVKQDVLLLEMQMLIGLADAKNGLDDQPGSVVALKDALAIFPQAVPPLFGEKPADWKWKQQIDETYREACRALLSTAQPAELQGVNMHFASYAELAPTWPESAKVISPVDPRLAEDNEMIGQSAG